MSFIGETANGQTIIRVFNKENMFMNLVESKFDQYSQSLGNIMMIDRWIGMISDIISVIIVGSITLLIVLNR